MKNQIPALINVLFNRNTTSISTELARSIRGWRELISQNSEYCPYTETVLYEIQRKYKKKNNLNFLRKPTLNCSTLSIRNKKNNNSTNLIKGWEHSAPHACLKYNMKFFFYLLTWNISLFSVLCRMGNILAI